MIGSILVVARNNSYLTKVAVNSALAQDTECNVLVINNDSEDGTGDWLKTKPVSVITYPRQESLSKCWNDGLASLFKEAWPTPSKVQTALVINNDVELRRDTYRMLAELEHAFVTAVSVNCQDQVGFNGDRDKSDLIKSMRPHPDFSCFMISKNTFELVGNFNESYFPAYCEDCDYHVRVHRAGIEAVCVDLPFYHAGAQTLESADLGEQARIKRGADANREKFRRQYGCLPGSPEYANLFK